MDQQFISLYLTIFIVIGMVAYAGLEDTYNLFRYINIQIRFQAVLIKMAFMKYEQRPFKKALKKSLQQLKKNG